MSDRPYDPTDVHVYAALGITVYPTDRVLTLDGVPVRLWVGVVPGTGRIDLYMHRAASDERAVQQWCESFLHCVDPPSGMEGGS